MIHTIQSLFFSWFVLQCARQWRDVDMGDRIVCHPQHTQREMQDRRRFARDKQMPLHKCRSRPHRSPVDEPASPSAASLLPPLDHDKMIAELRLHERGQDGLVDRGRLQRERGVLEGSLRLPVIK